MARRHTFSIVKLRSIEHSIRRQGMFDEGKEIGENPHLSLLLLPLSSSTLRGVENTQRDRMFHITSSSVVPMGA